MVDITNAVMQGIDGMVLLAETSIGEFFKDSVKMMSQICREAEAQFFAFKANQRYLEHQNLLKIHFSKKNKKKFVS